MCSKYDRHSLICQSCEGAKPGRKHDCHPDKVGAIIQLEAKLGRPLWDINADPTQATQTQIMSSANDEGAGALIARELAGP